MRVLAGLYKGRNLLPPVGQGTRPITGSVKKSLFGMLGEDLSGAVVVDLYCGTGTLGIEALSRGAQRCYFADLDRSAVVRLRRNLQAVGAQERSVVWQGDVEVNLARWLEHVAEPVDVAFVDPPYEKARRWDWPAVQRRIFEPLARRLADGGVVVLRGPGDLEVPSLIGPLAVKRTRRYGDMMLALLGLPEGGADEQARDCPPPGDEMPKPD